MLRTLQYYIDKSEINGKDIRYFPEHLVEELKNKTIGCNTNNIRERLEWLRGSFSEYPSCKACGLKLTSSHWDIRFSDYRQFCDKSCSASFRESDLAHKQKMIEKYGVEHPFSNKEVQAKRIKTNLEKYGNSHPHPWNSELFKTAIYKSHGTEVVRHIPGVSEKISANVLEKSKASLPIKISHVEDECSVKCISADTEWKTNRTDDLIFDWVHDCGREFKSNIFSKNPGKYEIRSCPSCSAGTSKIEQLILNFVKDSTASQVVSRDRSIITPFELDIYLPELKLAFEVDGSYWHSSKFTSADKARNKFDMCAAKGIKLITIQESKLYLKESIIKNRILNAIGSSNLKAVYARNTTIIELNAELRNFFFSQNHLDGDRPASICYALVHNNVVVMAMSFGKSRFSKKHEWEIIRSCANSSWRIIGGVSRLIKHFIKMQNPQSLITYADLDWGDNRSYEKAGMIFLRYTSPGYFYVSKKGTIVSRYESQKKKLPALLGPENYNPYKTEVQNMLDNGYLQIFNRGNAVFEYNSPD